MSSKLVASCILDLIYLALSPVLLAYALVASRCFTRPKLRRGLASKLWRTPCREGPGPSFWIHAVSVGEVLTAVPLVEELRRRFPGWDLRVSVSTYTGMETARKRLQGVELFWFPLDLSFVVRRFFRRHRPTAVILVELEVWPNFLLVASRLGVPVLVANGRITERSARRYRLGGCLTRRLAGLVSSWAVQNAAYRDRFSSLGVDPSRIEVLGNLKHDRQPPPLASRASSTRDLLGWSGRTVLVAGSTHPGEESALLGAYAHLRSANPDLRLVIAPRHVERLTPAEISGWGATEPPRRWSEIRDSRPGGGSEVPGSSILVVDTIGELELFYALADLVFVGGTLVPHGGHNLFEPARLGKAIVFGPSLHNFQDEANLLLGAAAAVRVSDPEGLERALGELLASPDARSRLGAAALAVTEGLRGATSRHVEWIERTLREHGAPGSS